MPGTLKPSNPRLQAVYDVIIDGSGTFKYILCKVYDPDLPYDYKYIIRGFLMAEFHADIYDDVDSQLEEVGIVCECHGGGMIYHDSQRQHIEVYGKSQGYGKACHSITADMLRHQYPHYKTITWQD